MSDTIGLAELAQRIRCSWARAYNLVLTGQLRAERAPNGRWRVYVSSIEAFERRQAAQKSAAADASASR
jgi:predicted site-specific integrase-resolvase